MSDLVHDKKRARDYDGLVHITNMWGRRAYLCRSHEDNEDIAMHGVWAHEPTTCLWCVVNARWR